MAGASADLTYVETAIAKRSPLLKVLRLLCLYSLTNNGLKAKQFDFFRREILQTYGFEYMFTYVSSLVVVILFTFVVRLNNLEKLGLLKRAESRAAPWSSLRKSLHLIVDDLVCAVCFLLLVF